MVKKAISTEVSFPKVSTAQEARVMLPIKVGMHVLGRAVTDVRVMRAATALVEAGYAVTLIDVEEKRNHHKEDVRGISLKHIIMSRSFFSTRFDRLALVRAAQLFVCSTLCLIQTQVDIYHAHDMTALPACYIAARLRHKPIIFESHEIPLFNKQDLSRLKWSKRWLCKILALLMAYIVPRCAGVITVSPPIAEEICHCYHVSEVALVRNIPSYQVVPKSDKLRRYLGLTPDMYIALYQGSLQSNRGLERLIHAAPFLESNIVIVIMGPAVETTRDQLENLIVSKEVADRVKLIPPVPYEDLLDWTASVDIGLIIYSPDHSSNVQMCLPNKFFEYLMAGVPVLSSHIGAVADIIKAYDVGQVVPSLEPEDIGEAINRMLSDPIGLAHKRNNALEAAKNEFYWEKESLQLTHLYQGILH